MKLGTIEHRGNKKVVALFDKKTHSICPTAIELAIENLARSQIQSKGNDMADVTFDSAPDRTEVQFNCNGQATGKMRNELNVTMVKPFVEKFELASDEGPFHGGDATAPPPLALFVAGLTGCIMTQIRAFAKRMDVTIDDLSVETRVVWDWAKAGPVYETGPKSFEIDITLDSPDPLEKTMELIETAKKGCFLEQTLGVVNTISHRIKTIDGFIDV